MKKEIVRLRGQHEMIGEPRFPEPLLSGEQKTLPHFNA
jgi:hypothetical protein